MKKLSKIKLLNIVVLEELEMRTIYGGSGTDKGDDSRSQTEKEQACSNKIVGDPCSYFNKANQLVYGRCSQNAFSPYRYCSTLNVHT